MDTGRCITGQKIAKIGDFGRVFPAKLARQMMSQPIEKQLDKAKMRL